jgi:D-alanyl-D-alanine carboxypeptidase (penicillin-binding protein 5/6)
MMKFFSPKTAYFLVCLHLLASAPPAEAARSSKLRAPASYVLKINGTVYEEKNPDTRRAPASLTKIMTALVVLEHCRLDEVATVSRAAARETGSRIGLRRGDRLRVRDLLAAMLIASANDAARALAEHAAGSQANFVKLMNRRAQGLKLRNTRFSNASGHDDGGLYSSAHDLAVLTEVALRHATFAQLVNLRSMRVTTVRGNRSYFFKNKNRLIGRYAGARGVKTGTTPKAGKCLVALAQRDDRRVLLVMMNSPSRWRTAPALLDAAFAADLAHPKRLGQCGPSAIGTPSPTYGPLPPVPPADADAPTAIPPQLPSPDPFPARPPVK